MKLSDVLKEKGMTGAPVLKLEVVPKENGKLEVTFSSGELSPHLAEHLAQHLADGLEEFVECIGARGVKVFGTGDPTSDDNDVRVTKTFGDEGYAPIDPKKVN